MGASRWALIPLALAVLLDAGLVARYETSAGVAVSRAIVRSTDGGSCETSTLIRNTGPSSPSDDLFVTDTWTSRKTVVTVAANPEFGPAGHLVPQSLQIISEGLDIERQQVQQLPAALTKSGRPALAVNYLDQMHRGAAWLSGPCVPFANPLRSHLRSVGGVQTPGGTYTVYRGRLTTAGGANELAKSEVWLGVRQDGRIGFEVLRQLPAPGANPTIVFVAKLFTYAGPQLTVLINQPAAQRVDFYDADYQDMLATITRAESAGSGAPAPSLEPPQSSSAASTTLAAGSA